MILFTFANLVRSILAKVISRAFYTSAHYQKAGTALENEYFLLALSTPREELAAKREREAASLGISGAWGGGGGRAAGRGLRAGCCAAAGAGASGSQLGR